jgi:pSer/pThr/pTyr-binding forkhead associated (FHA) protein
MLSGVAENRMRLVRALLTLGWLVLIVSLFWDPVTPGLTRPENVSSPFHLSGKIVEVQGKVVHSEPYSMTNRIFWTMLIPVLPLFFLIAGHETWRRICPLSFVSQIPRYLGWNRKRVILIRRTGQVEKQLALVGKESWWRKNVWYIQFGLLFIALTVRLLLVNSDRTALGLFFIGVIATALAVGYLWGGKTWCNYICPVAIVQKIYTEPRGLLESRAHISRQPITQSMCRASTAEGDRSICVGCTPNCPDIDLERSYWEGIEDPSLRHVYYAFFGLIVGFYCFFYFYSGGWDYYFSGTWTHEHDPIGDLFKPGLFINGVAIGIPKILSAPLILAVFVVAAVFLGKALEAFYRYLVRRMQRSLTEAEIINRCLSFSAYVSINTFYIFGGRSNLLLLPSAVLRLVDILIVALTTLWFWQAIQHSPMRYRREGLASSLLEQLRKLKVDISKFLEGRKLEELKPDEIYILAKTLPGFSREQRLQAYRNILEDALRMGKAESSASLELLREVRTEIGISDDEHRQLLQELGIDAADMSFDPAAAATFESWLRIDNYRRVIEPAVIAHLEQGQRLSSALADAEVAATIRKYREIYQVSEVEHANVITGITGSGGLIFERARRQLNLLAEDSALIFGLRCKMLADKQWHQIASILVTSTTRRSNAIITRLFSVLLTLGETPQARAIAAHIAELMGSDVELLLAIPVSTGARVTWAESLNAQLVNLLRGSPLDDASTNSETGEFRSQISFRSAIEKGTELIANLRRVAMSDDQLIGALALTAISYLDLGLARQTGEEIRRKGTSTHWLMAEAIAGLSGVRDDTGLKTATTGFTLTVASPNSGKQTLSFAKDYVTVGRSPDNDVVVIGQVVAPYHVAICRTGSRVEIRKCDPFSGVYVNGQRSESDSLPIETGARLSFLPANQSGSLIVVEWKPQSADFMLESHDAVTRLLWLSSATIFHNLELASLAEIAAATEVRRYSQGQWLCQAGDAATDAFLLQAGCADILATRDGQDVVIGALHEAAIVGELGVVTGRPRTASVRISSPVARILTINGERLRWLMESDASVSLGVLSVVAGYVKN